MSEWKEGRTELSQNGQISERIKFRTEKISERTNFRTDEFQNG